MNHLSYYECYYEIKLFLSKQSKFYTDVSILIKPFSILNNKLKNITGNYARCS